MFVTKLVGLMYICIFFMDVMLAVGFSGSFFGLIFTFLVVSIIFILLVISRQPQNRYSLAFLTPGLPFIPTIAITVNIYLIFKLSILTLVRFCLWMTLGLIMYFYYGITNSSLEDPSDEIELTVDQSYITPQKVPKRLKGILGNPFNGLFFRPQFNGRNSSNKQDPCAVWENRHGYENKMAEEEWRTNENSNWSSYNYNSGWNDQNQTINYNTEPTYITTTTRQQPPQSTQSARPNNNQKKDGFSSLFVAETSFPSWED